ncbi:potassium channel family protein [Oceanobacillus massiliensis]|uniref:potassium channel family protein n=1 Tax=Oceanobacillus massiliensis TaxID=1465765 RepID=UPI0002897703|nr:potassium channel family protein [Oceanobacillus massiliensis]
MHNFLIGAAIVFIGLNLYYFFANKDYRKSHFSTSLFLKLFFVLSGILLGFAVLYYVLSTSDLILVQDLSTREPIDPTFLNFLYFSGETLFSIGYGDMLPIGSARFFTIIEAAIGVLLPTAYFMKSLDSSNGSEDN